MNKVSAESLNFFTKLSDLHRALTNLARATLESVVQERYVTDPYSRADVNYAVFVFLSFSRPPCLGLDLGPLASFVFC